MSTQNAVDKAALLAYLKVHAEHPHLLVHAVLAGLATAIERGDFDEERKKPSGEG